MDLKPYDWEDENKIARLSPTADRDAALSAGARAYDRYRLMADTGATDREMGSVPERAAPGAKKKWFTHPTNPNLDGWYS